MISQISKSSRNKDTAKTSHGLTLVELLLVLVLVSIGLATIMPRLGGSISGWSAKETATSMLAATVLARKLARTRQHVVALCIDPNGGWFELRLVNDSAELESKSEDSIIARQFLGEGVEVVHIEGFERLGSQQGLVFWPDGRTRAAHIALAARETNELCMWHIIVKQNGDSVLQEVHENE